MTPRERDDEHVPPAAPALQRDLTIGSIPRHLIAFSLPMLAGSVLQVAHSLVNGVWVGRFLGPEALAAVTVSQPAIFVLIAIAGGLTLAANILVAQDAGARDWERLRRVVQTSYALIAIVSTVLMVIGLLNAERLLRFMGTPPEILSDALGYLRIYLWTLPFSFWLFLIGSLLRGVGDSKTPVYFQTVAVIVNAVLDPLLMFGQGHPGPLPIFTQLGLPGLGLNGTALATVIAQAVGVAGLLVYVAFKRRIVQPEWRRLRVEPATAWLLTRIGVPSMVQMSVVSVSMVGIVKLVSGFGPVAAAAFGAALRIDGVAFLPAMTLSMAASTLAGQNIGAGQFQRVGQVFRWGQVFSVSIALLIMAVVIGAPEVFIRPFTMPTDPQVAEVVAMGSTYLRIVGFTYVLFSVMFISNGVINGAGHTLITTLFSIISLWGVRLPLAAYLSRTTGSVTGIWYAMLISVGVGTMISLIYFFSGRWKRPIGNVTPSHG